MKIVSVVGTRPNFVKIASFVKAVEGKCEHTLIHTGQHYDNAMSKQFFDQLEIPKPDINLGIANTNYCQQMSGIILALDKELQNIKPDLVVVVGDVTSTLAAAFVAEQQNISVAHIEAGLRSFDPTMPEESNRVLTDRMSTFLFTTEESGNQNLEKEGIDKQNIHFVGNIMIDTLLQHKHKAEKSLIVDRLNLKKEEYAVLTLHRPSNVDSKESMERIFTLLEELDQHTKVVFPIHPRTKKNIERWGLAESLGLLTNIMITPPLGYLDFLHLMDQSKIVLTDSGGIQEETTVLGIPCITIRDNTERPVTVEKGTNLLVSTDNQKIINSFLTAKKPSQPPSIPLWDGKAAERIADILLSR